MIEHPDAEALSAYFDGEAAEWDAHVRTCPECRAHLERLERVRTAVSTPVPSANPADRQAAIGAALARDTNSSGPRIPRWAALGGVAAVVLGILVGVAATRDSGSKHQFSSASGSTGPVSALIVDAGDLGDVNDAVALRSKVEPRVVGRGTAAASGQSAESPSPSRAADASKQAVGAGDAGSEGGSTATGPVPCVGQARALQPGTQVLVYRATATWNGTPAVVLGFSPESPATSSPGRRSPTRVYVLSRSGCQLLSFQSYAP